MFPVAFGRERAAAEPADRRVENGRTCLERCERVRVAGVSRVVEVAADGDAERGDARDERRAPPPGDATPIVSARTSVSGRPRRPAPRSRRRASGSTSPSNGQPNATLSVTVERRPSLSRARDDLRCGGERLLDGRALVALVERLGDAEREAHLVEARRDEPLVAALVEREPGADDVRGHADGRDDLLRVRHLRHAPRVDEARDLDRRALRLRESPHQLGARRDVEDLRLVLQAVARADVVHRHARRLGQPRPPYLVTRCHRRALVVA